MAGLNLDDWQDWSLCEAMSEAADGRWSAFEVALLVPRQNGKGSILEARQIAGLFLLHERLQVHTAHEFKTCFEHFMRVVQLIESTPDLDRKVMRIRRGAGEQAIELKTGERLRFLARSGGSGRGMSGDTVYLDEAFALTAQIMGALLPTLSARPNPQLWYMSSAPKWTSEVLKNIRKRGQDDNGSPRLFFAEWAAPANASIDDPDGWYAANPALGIRISEDFVVAELDAMREMPSEFARERLGIPDGDDGAGGEIPMDLWLSLVDELSSIESGLSIALDVNPERSWASFASAGVRADGLAHVEVVDRRPGTGWVVDRAVELYRRWDVPIVLDPSSPAGGLLGALSAAGVPVVEVGQRDHAQACGELVDAVRNATVRHLGQASLFAALTGAEKRKSGDVWLWSRSGSHVDITPLVAVTLALQASGGDPESVYSEERGMLVLG